MNRTIQAVPFIQHGAGGRVTAVLPGPLPGFVYRMAVCVPTTSQQANPSVEDFSLLYGGDAGAIAGRWNGKEFFGPFDVLFGEVWSVEDLSRDQISLPLVCWYEVIALDALDHAVFPLGVADLTGPVEVIAGNNPVTVPFPSHANYVATRQAKATMTIGQTVVTNVSTRLWFVGPNNQPFAYSLSSPGAAGADLWVATQQAAVVGEGLRLPAGGFLYDDLSDIGNTSTTIATGEVFAVSEGASVTVGYAYWAS